MKVAQSVSEVLRDHVVLQSESIDRMYLNVYVPQLQRIGGVVWYLRGQLGQRFASTAGVAPKTAAFVASIERFVVEQGVEMVSFAKHQRKDEVTQQYLQRFDADEGVLYVGRAQEKARVVRTERRRNVATGMSYPWVVDGSAMVNHYFMVRRRPHLRLTKLDPISTNSTQSRNLERLSSPKCARCRLPSDG